MTDRRTAQCLTLALAAHARVASMQAENATRAFKGLAPAYDENSFAQWIEALDAIALKLCEVPGE